MALVPAFAGIAGERNDDSLSPDLALECTAMNEKPAASKLDPASKAATLAAALPYMRRYAGKTIVVKYCGHAMGDEHLADLFAQDVVLL